jgi:hypothetical protein
MCGLRAYQSGHDAILPVQGGTMSDPLVKWGPLIAAISGWPPTRDEADAKSDCILDLAAALQTERERVAKLEAARKEEA